VVLVERRQSEVLAAPEVQLEPEAPPTPVVLLVQMEQRPAPVEVLLKTVHTRLGT
jgi:hypothetical protein